MSDLSILSAAGLLAKCPERIMVGNWDDEWQEIRRRVVLLESYEHDAWEKFYE